MERFTVPKTAFAVFDKQDSGCVSYGIERDNMREFVKVATTPQAAQSLRRAIALHDSVSHPAIVQPTEVRTSPPVTLHYPWIDGQVLNHATTDGPDRSGLRRFLPQPVEERIEAVRTILDAHAVIAAAGFASVDLYDGCFLYDFDRHTMRLIDLDEYRPGPFVLAEARLPGSTRYMAPEEFERGSTIGERTTVFQLGRTIEHLLMGASIAARLMRDVASKATQLEPGRRFGSVSQLIASFEDSLAS